MTKLIIGFTCCVVRLQQIDATCAEVSLQGQQDFKRRGAVRRQEGRHQHQQHSGHLVTECCSGCHATHLTQHRRLRPEDRGG